MWHTWFIWLRAVWIWCCGSVTAVPLHCETGHQSALRLGGAHGTAVRDMNWGWIFCDMTIGEDSGHWYRKMWGLCPVPTLHTLKGWATQKLKCALFIKKPSDWLDPSFRWMGPHSSRDTHGYTEDVPNIMLSCVWQNLTKMIEQRPQWMIPRVGELLLWSISQKTTSRLVHEI